jgi:hypothetical protein
MSEAGVMRAVRAVIGLTTTEMETGRIGIAEWPAAHSVLKIEELDAASRFVRSDVLAAPGHGLYGNQWKLVLQWPLPNTVFGLCA